MKLIFLLCRMIQQCITYLYETLSFRNFLFPYGCVTWASVLSVVLCLPPSEGGHRNSLTERRSSPFYCNEFLGLSTSHPASHKSKQILSLDTHYLSPFQTLPLDQTHIHTMDSGLKRSMNCADLNSLSSMSKDLDRFPSSSKRISQRAPSSKRQRLTPLSLLDEFSSMPAEENPATAALEESLASSFLEEKDFYFDLFESNLGSKHRACGVDFALTDLMSLPRLPCQNQRKSLVHELGDVTHVLSRMTTSA